MFYSNHNPKLHCFELGAWDTRRIAALLSAPQYGQWA